MQPACLQAASQAYFVFLQVSQLVLACLLQVNVPVGPSVQDVPEFGVTKVWPPLAVHADQIQLIWYCCLHCSFCSGIVQAINGGLPFAAACSFAHSVQPLSLLAVTLEKTHPPSPGWAQVLAWVFAALVQVL